MCLSARRPEMSWEGQAMCFFAVENSIFAGDKLLTAPNPDVNEDMKMFKLLGWNPQKPFTKTVQPQTVEASESVYQALGENQFGLDPVAKIERNEVKKQEAKSFKV